MLIPHRVILQGITCEAYGPLGHSKTDLLAHPEVTAVAKEVDRSPAQVRCSLAVLAFLTAHRRCCRTSRASVCWCLHPALPTDAVALQGHRCITAS